MPGTTMASSLRRSAESYWSRLVYYWLGPTTVHYRLEAALLASLTLATVANLRYAGASPPSTSGRAWTWDGDALYALLVFAWLVRHLLHRWLCLWDATATMRAPTLAGCLGVLLTAHASPGHTFDRPTQAAATFLCTGSTGTAGGAAGGQLHLGSLLPTGWKYGAQWTLNWFWYPLLRPLLGPALSAVAKALASVPSDVASFVEDRTGWKVAARIGAWRQAGYSLQLQHSPTLPFLLPHALVLLYGILWYSSALRRSRPAELAAGGAASPTPPFGAHVKAIPPSWGRVVLVVATAGASAGLWTSLWYRRAVAPLPDQAVGPGVARELRRPEPRASAASGSSSGGGGNIGGGSGGGGGIGSGSGGGKQGGGGGGGSSRAAAAARSREHELLTSWPERARPLEGRVRLERNVRILRWVEAAVLCGALPRTAWLCRATGHCPPPRLWELSRLLYPIGVSTPLRKDGAQAASLFVGGWVSAVWIMVSIAILVNLLLMAQAVVLSKTYLATVAHVSNEWDPVEEVGRMSDSAADPTAAEASTSPPPPPAWDPRRRYKKGDRVAHPAAGPRRTVYQAAVHAPADKPRLEGTATTTSTTVTSAALQLFPLTDALRMEREVGHPRTSALLWKLAGVQCCVAALQFLVLVVQTIFVRDVDTAGGATALLLAHLVAAYGLVSVGTPSYSRLARLGSEIRPSNGVG